MRQRLIPRSANVASPRTFTHSCQVANQLFFFAWGGPFRAAVAESHSLEFGPLREREPDDSRDSISGVGSPLSAAFAARCRWFFRSLREARGTHHSFKALAPPMISISSVVIAACLARLYCSVNRSIISEAFLVAESIAVMRAPSSEAIDS